MVIFFIFWKPIFGCDISHFKSTFDVIVLVTPLCFSAEYREVCHTTPIKISYRTVIKRSLTHWIWLHDQWNWLFVSNRKLQKDMAAEALLIGTLEENKNSKSELIGLALVLSCIFYDWIWRCHQNMHSQTFKPGWPFQTIFCIF